MDQKLAPLFNFTGGLSGFLAIGLLIWKGGALVEKVDNHEARLSSIELLGSVGLREHSKMDDERVGDIKQRQNEMSLRMNHQEESLSRLMEIVGDIKAVNAKLDALKEQIKMKP